ncbi:hypothetical protein Halhy_0030 [Haliscomenobacter hydrossis DSM 1100]|uniref:Uncharacterized protein n=2 Tax=Haliscomenobacter TaxID=2349 RepID=F4KRF4_HALH1|nr:hypothetical protein Halhy_0030 [Haliscomenobacter hydrossis DSM 1100]
MVYQTFSNSRMKAFQHQFLSFSQPPALLVLLVLSAYFNWVCPEETPQQTRSDGTVLVDLARPNPDRVYPRAFEFGFRTSAVFAYGSFSFQAYLQIYNCSLTARWRQLTRAQDLLPAVLSSRLLLIQLPRSQEFI